MVVGRDPRPCPNDTLVKERYVLQYRLKYKIQGVPKEAKLRWTPGVGVKAHRVYLGTNPDNLKYMGRFEAGDSSEVKLPRLEKRQRYWWQVDAEKSDGSVIKGKLWSFLTGRIVGWWELDETEGTKAADSAGSGLDGTLFGGSDWVTGRIGGALHFDGIDDYVDCGNSASLQITGTAISLAAWAKWDTDVEWNRHENLHQGLERWLRTVC